MKHLILVFTVLFISLAASFFSPVPAKSRLQQHAFRPFYQHAPIDSLKPAMPAIRKPEGEG